MGKRNSSSEIQGKQKFCFPFLFFFYAFFARNLFTSRSIFAIVFISISFMK